jgi:hypothetical protein
MQVDHLGFYVQRALSPEGPFETLPNAFLQADPLSREGQHYHFKDLEAPAGRRVFYRLLDLSREGQLTAHPIIDIKMPAIAENQLSGNHPNPFNQSTSISFQLAQDGPVQLLIYDAIGRPVRRLLEGASTAGFHHILWDGCDETGSGVASGVYFARLLTEGQSSTLSIQLVR